MEERTGVERQGRQAERPTRQEARVGLGKRDRGREERPRDCSRGGETQEAGKLMITASPEGSLTVGHFLMLMLRFTAERNS